MNKEVNMNMTELITNDYVSLRQTIAAVQERHPEYEAPYDEGDFAAAAELVELLPADELKLLVVLGTAEFLKTGLGIPEA